MHYIASSWDAIPKDTIANLFKHRGFRRDDGSSTSDTMIVDYVNANDNVPVCDTAALDKSIEDITQLPADTLEKRTASQTPMCVYRRFWKRHKVLTRFDSLFEPTTTSLTCFHNLPDVA